MRISPLLILLTLSINASAQDDYPDYRSKRDVFTRIQEPDIRADVATFTMGGLDEGVGKTPLQTIPVTAFTDTTITFSGNGTTITITTAPFDATKHKLNYFDPEKKYLVRIDSKPYFGDYGKVPKTTIKSVTMITGRDTIQVPKEALADLANPVLFYTDKGRQVTNNKVFLSADGHKVYIYMLKPEAGGSYEVTWVIKDKQYMRRVVDFGFLR